MRDLSDSDDEDPLPLKEILNKECKNKRIEELKAVEEDYCVAPMKKINMRRSTVDAQNFEQMAELRLTAGRSSSHTPGLNLEIKEQSESDAYD